MKTFLIEVYDTTDGRTVDFHTINAPDENALDPLMDKLAMLMTFMHGGFCECREVGSTPARDTDPQPQPIVR